MMYQTTPLKCSIIRTLFAGPSQGVPLYYDYEYDISYRLSYLQDPSQALCNNIMRYLLCIDIVTIHSYYT